LLVVQDVMFFNQHPRIVAFTAASRLPALFAEKQVVESGGLMAYGPVSPPVSGARPPTSIKFSAALTPLICRLKRRRRSSWRSISKRPRRLG
jgi:hypothetical protein